MSVKRFVDKKTTDQQEKAVERSLRPDSFANYFGQERLKSNLKIGIEAAQKRQEPLDHLLFYGAPGLGKTTLATVISNQMGTQIKTTSGPAIDRPGDLISIITNLKANDILFIDEIHQLNRQVIEALYSAMEDFHIDIILGKGAAAKSIQLSLPKFTLIGATTRIGSLPASLRDRFGLVCRLEFYQPNELRSIIVRSASILGVEIKPEAAQLLADRCRLTPRIANRLLRRVRDYATINNNNLIDTEVAEKTFQLLQIDELGLDESDRRLLATIEADFSGGPVGLNTLSAILGDETSTIEDYYEPFLLQIGFIERTPQGRKTTIKAKQHLKSKREK